MSERNDVPAGAQPPPEDLPNAMWWATIRLTHFADRIAHETVPDIDHYVERARWTLDVLEKRFMPPLPAGVRLQLNACMREAERKERGRVAG